MKNILLALTAITALNATTAKAEAEVLFDQNNVSVVKFMDDFSEEMTSCQLNVSDWKRGSSRLSIYGRTMGTLKVQGGAGNYGVAGFKYKIDKNAPVEVGRQWVGGEAQWGKTATSELLDQLAKGSKIIVHSFPDNQFADPHKGKFDLSGSATAVKTLKNCLAGKA